MWSLAPSLAINFYTQLILTFGHHCCLPTSRSHSACRLILATCLLHLFLALILGWILGPTSTVPYNCVAFFAISTLLLYFANVQLIYFLYTCDQVRNSIPTVDLISSEVYTS